MTSDIDHLAAVLHEIDGEFCSPFSTPEAHPEWPGGHPFIMHRSQAAAILTGLGTVPEVPLIEAGALLGVTPATLRQQTANGKLRATKRGRDWWVTTREVERYRRESRRT